jgi:hypothetical protein
MMTTVGVLKGVEAGHEVEGGVGEGQLFELAHAEVALRHAAAGDRQQRLGGVQPRNACAPLGGHLRRQPGAAARVEIGGASTHRQFVQDRGIHRPAARLLDRRPVVRRCAPQPSIHNRSRQPLFAHPSVLLR